MKTAQIKIPAKLAKVFTAPGKRYRGAYGGRGSAKTRTFAKMTAVKAIQFLSEGKSGIILCGREFMNSLDESSFAEVKGAILDEPFLASHFDIGEKYIRTKCGRIQYAFAGLRHNLDSIKSKAKILLCWVDEAEPVSDGAWIKLIPTIREEGSEIWVTWNPEWEQSATHKRFRQFNDPDAIIVEMNWRDNPWFPEVLNKERLRDKEQRPEQYEHIWEGDFVTVHEGAYYAADLTTAKLDGRITSLALDPLMSIKAIWDIGGTGAKADATAISIEQWIGPNRRILDGYEAVGQPLAAHVSWLRENGYENAECILPHDGGNSNMIFATTYENQLKEAGFSTRVIPNQGAGAAMQRVRAARRVFPSTWFDEDGTKNLRQAVGWYHEKKDPVRGVGLGPEHDHSSHYADCFGLGAVVFEEQQKLIKAMQGGPKQAAALKDPHAGLTSKPRRAAPLRGIG